MPPPPIILSFKQAILEIPPSGDDEPPSLYLTSFFLLHTNFYYLPLQIEASPLDLGEMGVLSVIILLLILGSSLMSGSEVAFFSLSTEQKKELEKEKIPSSQRILASLESPSHLLATILIVNNLFNIAIILCTQHLLSKVMPTDISTLVQFLITAVFATAILVIFGEIIPKIYANRFNIRLARFVSLPVQIFRTVLYPLSHFLVRSSSIIEKRIQQYNKVNVEDIDKAIDMMSDTEKDERDILKSVIKFGNITAKQIMQARVDVQAMDVSQSFEELRTLICETKFSRIPVYNESLDEIKGLVYAKDILGYTDGKAPANWRKLIKEAYFVPETRKIDSLLRDFQKRRQHMAIVIDEYGGTSGIVTLEDVLEEVVGEIDDEHDEYSDIILSRSKDGSYIFEGKTSINDFCKAIDQSSETFNEVRGESDTLAGLMLEISGRFMQLNESCEHENYRFTLLATEGQRIEKIKVKIGKENDESDKLGERAKEV